MSCVRCIVSGRVQGVWFRQSTWEKALELGVAGSAVNLPDGTVEVIACGPEAAVTALQEWLWQGPPLARVDGVRCQALESAEPPSGFSVG